MKIINGIARYLRSIALSLGGLLVIGSTGFSPGVEAAVTGETGVTCSSTVTADVVAFDQPVMFNRLGAQNVNYMVYALRRDVVNTSSGKPLTAGGLPTPGKVSLRPDKRARPLVLRVASGQCLEVKLENLLDPVSNPFNADPAIMQSDNQVAGREISFHPLGMQLVTGINDDGSYVGKNDSSLGGPGFTK